MTTYQTPGVYVEEISVFPPSIAPVATAIPAFIGVTQRVSSEDKGVPQRITSLPEFVELFGTADAGDYEVDVVQDTDDGTGSGTVTSTTATFKSGNFAVPPSLLYHSIRLFYANGGGPCWVVSIAKEADTAPTGDEYVAALATLEAYDEPTIIAIPDAAKLGSKSEYEKVADGMLQHCSKTEDRFAILDVPDTGTPLQAQGDWFDETADGSYKKGIVATMRQIVSSDLAEKKYGAAYIPYLKSALTPPIEDGKVKITSHTVGGAAGPITADTLLSHTSVVDDQTAVYDAVKQLLTTHVLTLPPSGAVAGVYCKNDDRFGVWHAPANTSLSSVSAPAIEITNDTNGRLNVDATSGKSINAIRSFTGKGTMVWGARTLAGNDNENRYVGVRRFLNFAEESTKKAMDAFVFESNDANTWVKVKSMIDSFLTKQWRDGALVGAKPEEAFYVSVGLGKTMTFDDILNGVMNVEIGLAIVRPAEFIVLKFMQKMQTS